MRKKKESMKRHPSLIWPLIQPSVQPMLRRLIRPFVQPSIRRRAETGVALLIAIFVLMLVSVVAIALLLSSGTETALSANYRSSANAYYAAVAGLEEARGRLLANNPNYFNNSNPGFIPVGGLVVGDVRYIVNPANGEDVLTAYPDKEYGPEFQVAGPPPNPPTINSVSGNNAQNLPGPFYKWVRINVATKQSLNLDVDSKGIDKTPVLYDGSRLNTTAGNSALEITSLAVLPNGTQKMLQYVVAPAPVNLPPLLAALTLSGSQDANNASQGAAFLPPTSNPQYVVRGDDQNCSGNTTGSEFPAIGVFTDADAAAAKAAIPASPAYYRQSYTGAHPAPDVFNVSNVFPAALQQPNQLDTLIQSLTHNADAVLTPSPPSVPPYLGTALAPDLHAAAMTAGMSSANPVTLMVNGNLDISDWGAGGHNYGPGYGLLLVTGTFTYDPDTNWNGMVLVIGQGIVNNTQSGGANTINGAMFVAKTRGPGPNFNLLPSLGGASVQFGSSMGGNGIRYSSCWIQKTTPTANYKILSFHEISQ